MPRLDNSDPVVISEFELDYIADDPGAVPPIDVCIDCAENHFVSVDAIDHPPYELEEYVCRDCGCELTEDDN